MIILRFIFILFSVLYYNFTIFIYLHDFNVSVDYDANNDNHNNNNQRNNNNKRNKYAVVDIGTAAWKRIKAEFGV